MTAPTLISGQEIADHWQKECVGGQVRFARSELERAGVDRATALRLIGLALVTEGLSMLREAGQVPGGVPLPRLTELEHGHGH